MTYPSVDEFSNVLLSHPLEKVVQEYIFQGVPYVFRERPELLDILRRHLCSALKFLEENVVVVGSAKIGFSLNPNNFPRQFSDESDIDILVVDEKLFDSLWMAILRWHYPRRITVLGGEDGRWMRERRQDLYWGAFFPDKIRFQGLSFPEILKPLRDNSTAWFNAFRSLSQYPELVSRNVSGRLYRTWEHALLYQTDGLRQIKDVIRPTRKDT